MTDIVDVLDFQIQDYIEATFIDSKKETVYKAFSLLYAFQLEDPEYKYIEILSRDSVSDDAQDNFLRTLDMHVYEALSDHGVIVNAESTLYDRVEILSGIFLLSYLEDYTYVLTVLDSYFSPIEKIGRLLSECCLLNEIEVLDQLESVDDHFLDAVRALATDREDVAIVDFDESKDIIVRNLKDYNELHPDTIGYTLLKDDIAIGISIDNYLALLDGSIDFNTIRDKDLLATQIFSLLLLSRSGINGLLLLYRKYSMMFLDDINTISEVEARLIHLLKELLDHKKFKEEQI